MLLEIESPIPVPFFLVVENGVNNLSIMFLGIPQPVSTTDISTLFSALTII